MCQSNQPKLYSLLLLGRKDIFKYFLWVKASVDLATDVAIFADNNTMHFASVKAALYILLKCVMFVCLQEFCKNLFVV
jgi:hypothetical protein